MGESDEVEGNNLQIAQSVNSGRITVNLLDLGLYRIKSHCNYDLQMCGSPGYSVFQVEVLDEKLKKHYGGTHILEVWTKQGERIFQKVMSEEITNWRLFENTLVFRGCGDSKMIYVAFLDERKMTAVQHPFENFNEADLIYFDSFLILI